MTSTAKQPVSPWMTLLWGANNIHMANPLSFLFLSQRTSGNKPAVCCFRPFDRGRNSAPDMLGGTGGFYRYCLGWRPVLFLKIFAK